MVMVLWKRQKWALVKGDESEAKDLQRLQHLTVPVPHQIIAHWGSFNHSRRLDIRKAVEVGRSTSHEICRGKDVGAPDAAQPKLATAPSFLKLLTP
jgi:hypothetical protein